MSYLSTAKYQLTRCCNLNGGTKSFTAVPADVTALYLPQNTRPSLSPSKSAQQPCTHLHAHVHRQLDLLLLQVLLEVNHHVPEGGGE
jgi:hypothetical protein